MTDFHYDALAEIATAYLHAYIDAPYKQNFAKTTQEWLTRRGFYGRTCIIPYPPHERWRSMMGMPSSIKVDRDFDDDGKMIDHR